MGSHQLTFLPLLQMSLLSSAVYANSTTPCWTPAGGGGVGSNVVIPGTLYVGGDTTMAGTLSLIGSNSFVDTSLLRTQGITLVGSRCNGFGQIQVGNNTVTLSSPSVESSSIILLSRIGEPTTGVFVGSGQGTLLLNQFAQTTGSFQVDLVDLSGISLTAVDSEVNFNWVVINQA